MPAKHKRSMSSGMFFRKYGASYAGLAPFYLLMLVFIVAPMVYGIVMSFTNWAMNSSKIGISFTGLKNYTTLLSGEGTSSERFLKSLHNLAWYIPFTIVIGLSISMILALVVNNVSRKAYSFFRAVYFVPTVLPLFLCGQIFRWFFSPDSGIISNWLASLGIGKDIVWADTSGYAIALVVIIDIWNAIGYNFIIFSTGMQDVPLDLYEAAELDGASSFQKMIKITIPMIEPVIFFVITYSLISALQVYDIPNVLHQATGGPEQIGGPGQVCLYPVMEMVRNVYAGSKSGLGRACAEGVILMGIIMVVTAISFLGRRKNSD